MLNKIFGIFLILTLTLCGCLKKENGADLYESVLKRDKLIVGMTFDSKPFSYIDENGQMQGVEVDLVKELSKRILGSEDKVVFKHLSIRERISAVNSQDIDIAISAITINPKRKNMVYFSHPYFIAGQVVCTKKDSKIKSVEDLINKKVVVILGTTGEESIESFAPNALVWGFVDTHEAIREFKRSPVDAIITDDALLRGLAMDNGEYTILPKRLTKEPYGIAFKKSKESKSLIRKINETLKEIKEDGTLFMIEDNWGLH